MSALDDIKSALMMRKRPQGASKRVILVGRSAEGSIVADLAKQGGSALPQWIGGFRVEKTGDFLGWAIEDRDAKGRVIPPVIDRADPGGGAAA